jgi:hypothetical protein
VASDEARAACHQDGSIFDQISSPRSRVFHRWILW